MRFRKGFTIFNQAVLIAIVFLIVQQLIVASSTMWITRLIGSIQLGSFSFLWLGLYLGSLFLPYFPGAAALIEMAKAKVRAQVSFVNRFAEVYAGNVLEWSQASQHTKKTSTLTGEAPRAMDAYLDYVYHLASSGLNVAFNLLALAVVIESLLLVSYGIGLGISFLILKLQKKRKKILALRSQQGRIHWIGMLLKAWDHVLLNNRYNFHIWKDRTEKRGERFKWSAIKLEGYSQAVAISMAFALLIPSFLLVGILAYTRRTDLVWLAMLVVILPRLFQVLAYSYEMLFVLADFPMQQGRLGTVLKLVDPSNSVDIDKTLSALEKRIHWHHISTTFGSEDQDAYAFMSALPAQGRITLKGENGSGKTSLLLLLKQKYGEKAFYLPAKHDLLFYFSKDKLSTGQYARKLLEELIGSVEAPILLLDEWDANLDAENAKKTSDVIAQLAVQKCVIESRHMRINN